MTLILSTKESKTASGSGSFPGIYASHSYSPPSAETRFSTNAGGSSITVNFLADPTTFPLEYVEYTNTSGQVVRINGPDAWDHVPPPAQSPQITKMQEASGDVYDYTLTVISKEEVAGEEGGDSTYITHTTVFEIEIWADYDISKNILKEAIDARR